jgi:hypothetical protein
MALGKLITSGSQVFVVALAGAVGWGAAAAVDSVTLTSSCGVTVNALGLELLGAAGDLAGSMRDSCGPCVVLSKSHNAHVTTPIPVAATEAAGDRSSPSTRS